MMELVMQYVKYLLEGLAVAAAAYYIPQKKTSLREVAMIALAASASFAVLDLFAPAVASGARQGAGFGIGANHVGFGEGFDNHNEEGDDEPEVEEPFYGGCSREKEGFYGGWGSNKYEKEGFYGNHEEHHDEEHHDEEEDNVEGFYHNHDGEDEDKVEGFYHNHKGEDEDDAEGFANTIDNFEDDDEDEDDGEDFAVEGFNI